MRAKNAFTLIELLVVIAIIAMLLAILIPSLNTVKQMAAGSVCLYNQSGLTKAYYIYSQDNDDRLAISNQDPDRWVDRPHYLDPATGARDYSNRHNSTLAEKENGIMNGTLFPYAETTKVYHCPADRRSRANVGSRGKGAYRSYALPAGANSPPNTNGWNDAGITISGYVFYPLRKYTDFQSPGSKYVFVEENYTHLGGANTSLPPNAGYNGGVWSFWAGNNYTSWWDPLAPWHNDRTNLGYADGHAEKLVWKDEETVKFAYDRLSVPSYNQPNNPDQEYMSRAYPCIR